MLYFIIFINAFILCRICLFILANLFKKLHLDKNNLPDIVISIIMALLCIYLYYLFGFSYEFFGSVILLFLFMEVYISDFYYMIILDTTIISTLIFFLIVQLYFFNVQHLLLSIGTGLLTFSFFYAIKALFSRFLKKEALGFGDVKLSFIIGFIFELPFFFIILFLSAFLALPYTYAATKLNSSTKVPFGPFMVSAILLVFLFIDKFQNIFTFFIK